jgi:flagellar assembly protein FliH
MDGFDPLDERHFRISARKLPLSALATRRIEGGRVLFAEDFQPPAARRAAVPPAPPPPPPAPTFTETELEEARRAAFREGRDAGRTAARAEAEATGQAALAAIAAELAGARAAAATAAQDAAEVAVRLVLGQLAALFPSLSARLAAADIAAMANAVLPHLAAEPRVTLRVCPPLADTLRPTLAGIAEAAGFRGELTLRPDPAIAPDGAALTWAAGAALRDPTALAAALCDLLSPLNLAPLMPEARDVERAA